MEGTTGGSLNRERKRHLVKRKREKRKTRERFSEPGVGEKK